MMHLCLILSGVFHLSAGTQSGQIKQDTGVVSVSIGDNVILHCFLESQATMHFSWYRQTIGGKPELLSMIYKYDNPNKIFHSLEDNPRFTVQLKKGINHLHISNVHLSDSATYFCGSSHTNMVEFGEGLLLSVKGARLQEIVLGPVSEPIQHGGSVTLNCTVHTGRCDGDHSVYWFRHGKHQGILHTHRGQCDSVSTPGPSPSQSCVYYLQKNNLSSSDSGTYNCAVASCGEILFGKGTKLLIADDVEEDVVEDQMAQMSIFFWLSIIRTGILLFFLAVCTLIYMFRSW